MSGERKPSGERFSHVYLESGKMIKDAVRLRTRLSFAFSALGKWSEDEERYFMAELGVEVPYSYGYDWRRFIRTCELRDALDIVTLAYRLLMDRRRGDMAQKFANEVSRIFAEEGAAYSVDDAGGVHLAVDTEFARNRVAAIASLEGARYRAALTEFDAAFTALDGDSPDTKEGVRRTFGAAEALFRLMCPRAPRLGAKEARDYLGPIVDATHKADATAIRAAQRSLSGLSDWIDAAHFYRHEQGTEEPTAPPFDLAILLISQGAAFLRWLAALDKAIGGASAK
jgi:hypothetical protein